MVTTSRMLLLGVLTLLTISPRATAQPELYQCPAGTWDIYEGDFDEHEASINAPAAAAAAFGDPKPVKARLTRTCKHGQGTYGTLEFNGFQCFTIEPPDRGNKPNISCIPEGTYTCRRVNSPRFGNTFEITGVDGRTHILFHGGNCAANSSGCVILGAQFDPATGRIPGGQSGPAVKKFLEKLKGVNTFEIEICYAPPTPTPAPTATPRPTRAPTPRPRGASGNR